MNRLLQIRIILILCVFFSKVGFAQKSSYLEFLKVDTSASNGYFYGGAHYVQSPMQTDFRANGIYGQVGFNLARLFSKKMILGVSVDFKGWKGLNAWKPSDAFRDDFNAAYLPQVTTPEDLAKAEMIKNAVNNVENKNFQGNYFGRIGVSFSPFPRAFGGFLIEVKRGYCSFPIYGYYDDPNIDNVDSDFAFFDFWKVSSGSIYFKPFTFRSSCKTQSFSSSRQDWKNYITIGLHYERLNLNEGDFYGINLQDIVNDEFLKKHGIQNRFGISLGIGLY
jgi:hypothetical protein